MQTKRSVNHLIKSVVLIYLIGAALGGMGAPVGAQQPTNPTNLLTNGDFEAWDWNVNSWPLQDGISEIQVCPGWRAYYVDNPPPNVPLPESWKRPEFRDVKAAEFPNRVRSGFLAQKYFSFGGQHIAGLMQQVGGIAPGTPLRFSAYMMTWGCMAGEGEWNVCPTGDKSNNPSPMHTRIGIDPTGGTNPWAASVVWSAEREAYDQWTLFQVDATAQNSTVTVFTYSHADWFDSVFRIHNDVYIDDASLIALNETPAPPPTATSAPPMDTPVSAPEDTPAPEPTSSSPTATPQPTATATMTPTVTSTSTPLPSPTATATATASPTPTLTRTSAPPTPTTRATPSPTAVPADEPGRTGPILIVALLLIAAVGIGVGLRKGWL
jgi:hypothetical protein